MNDIIPINDGYSVQAHDKTLFLANAELVNVGCLNCVWRMHGQCPHNLNEGDLYSPKDVVETDKGGKVITEKGTDSAPICPELITFIVGLAEKGDSITAVWEKFLIYKVRIQESVDYKDYLQLKNQIKEATAKGTLNSDALEKLRMNETAAKIWWSKLNESAISHLQKVVDRESKKDTGKSGAGIFNAQTINFHQAPNKEIDKK